MEHIQHIKKILVEPVRKEGKFFSAYPDGIHPRIRQRIETAITQVRSKIERGETIAQPLRASGVFPPMVAQMIGAGESTGALDAMLAKIAEFYEDGVDVAIAGLLTLLEPVMICVLGVIVGGIVIAMYMPMFELISQLS